jgi:hypothetical protein
MIIGALEYLPYWFSKSGPMTPEQIGAHLYSILAEGIFALAKLQAQERKPVR